MSAEAVPPAAEGGPAGGVLLYFVRHGETDWNRARRLQGSQDIALNALGRTQAAHCGDVLRDVFARTGRKADDFDFVSSPLLRARETMELLRPPLGLPPRDYRCDGRLAELSFGEWEGFTFEELRVKMPAIADIAAREHDKWHFRPPGGESYEDLLGRVRGWLDTVTCDTVAVAHGGVARVLFAHYCIMPARAAPLGDIPQGVVLAFENGQMTRYE